jgi:hypothetical protein
MSSVSGRLQLGTSFRSSGRQICSVRYDFKPRDKGERSLTVRGADAELRAGAQTFAGRATECSSSEGTTDCVLIRERDGSLRLERLSHTVTLAARAREQAPASRVQTPGAESTMDADELFGADDSDDEPPAPAPAPAPAAAAPAAATTGGIQLNRQGNGGGNDSDSLSDSVSE